MFDDGAERRFRLKLARRDEFCRLIVTASSDSILTAVPRVPELFDPPEVDCSSGTEQWVLAYRLQADRGARTTR